MFAESSGLRRLFFHWRAVDKSRKIVVLETFSSVSRVMKDFLVCLSSGELALFLWPMVMFVVFVIAMCGATMKQCREDGLCTRRTVLAHNV